MRRHSSSRKIDPKRAEESVAKGYWISVVSRSIIILKQTAVDQSAEIHLSRGKATVLERHHKQTELYSKETERY